MKYLPGFTLDSFDALRLTQGDPYPQGCYILTADVESLYPSIDTIDGLRLVRQALTTFTPYSTDRINTTIDLLEFVLTHNYITFGNSHFLQISGTAMGTSVAVSYSCIYLSMLEFEVFQTLYNTTPFTHYNNPFSKHNQPIIPPGNPTPPVSYKRYIDDIMAIFTSYDCALKFITSFNNLRTYIKLTFNIVPHSQPAIFLDIQFTLTPYDTNLHLESNYYSKPISKHLYIPSTSAHPRHVFRNFITSRLTTMKLYCTHHTDFINHSDIFKNQLIRRNVNIDNFQLILGNLPDRRDIYLKRLHKRIQPSTPSSTPYPLVFTTTDNPTLSKLKIHELLKPPITLSQQTLNKVFNNKAPILAKRLPPNLGSKLQTYKYPHNTTHLFQNHNQDNPNTPPD